MSVSTLGRGRMGVAAREVAISRGTAITLALAGVWTGLFATLAVARHEAFWTARFDLGNMVQAIWSTLQLRPLESTSAAGEQITRFAAHADPLLIAYTPVYAIWPDPRSLLVAQAVAVASGALPAYWLGRRWIGDENLALIGPVAYLLYPTLQWAVLTDLHAVTLAVPLLMFAIWAAEADRIGWLIALSALALMSKEQVGIAVAGLGVWMIIRHRRRLVGAGLAIGALVWTVVAVAVIIPSAAASNESPFAGRYSELGDSPGAAAGAVLNRPWEAIAIAADHGGAEYLAGLLLPLLLMPLAAPLLVLVALPEIAINLLSDWPAQRSIEFHYGSVIVPFFIAATILGFGRAIRGELPGPLRLLKGRGRELAIAVGAAGLVGTLLIGPLPTGSPLGSDSRRAQYSAGAHADALRAATDVIPDDGPVSVSNYLGARLSERERVLTFPEIQDAQWIIVDEERPYLIDRRSPAGHARAVARLRIDPAFDLVFERDGVLVFERSPAAQVAASDRGAP
jgi:uncharacterized membrane protein